MKKIFIALAIIISLSGCRSGNIKPGNYVMVTKNSRPIYLIDIKTGERLVELNPEKFYVEIQENKKIASFIVEYMNFNTQSDSKRPVELGFFNGKIKESDFTSGEPETMIDNEAILIQSGFDLESADNSGIVGKTLSSYGPVLYTRHSDGYYYFHIGINSLKVKEEACTAILKPVNIGGEQVIEGDKSDLAYKALSVEMQVMIVDKNDYYEEQKSLDAKGVTVTNRDMSREFNLSNQDVIIITFIHLNEENRHLQVYLDANVYSFLGIKFVTLVPEETVE